MTGPAVELVDVRKAFGRTEIIRNVNLSIPHGERHAIIGPNGAGKTTLFNMLAGSYRSQSGSILIHGREAAGHSAQSRISMGLGRTFQIPKPFPQMTVLENVLTGGQNQAGESILPNFLAFRRVASEERAAVAKAEGLLAFVKLSHLAQEPARVLSGGQRKLLELARVLMADPSILLLDEPAAGVNPALLEFIIEKVLELNGQGKSILLIEHNMDMVTRLCHRVVVMAGGRYLTEGKPQDVARNPAVIEAYLGATA